MAGTLKILAVHGVGGHAPGGEWQEAWTEAIAASLAEVAPGTLPEVAFVTYDDVFRDHEITALGTLEAVARLASSGWHSLWDRGEARDAPPRVAGRGLRGVPERLRWTAGMVLQWLERADVRRRTRRRLEAAIREHAPEVIAAHSLGSLIAYDTFVQPENRRLIPDSAFVSFGSQIANPFVRGQYGGRIVPLRCRFWYHLWNEYDDVFTAPVRLAAENFEQVDCPFDIAGLLDHDAAEYLGHPNASALVWRELADTERVRRRSRRTRGRIRRGGENRRRALLVGINEYPAEEERLSGCVNDVFLMSSVLQEAGFAAEDIRVVLDERATARGIRERLHWLLDGTRDGDERVFYYSGHGAQIPGYGNGESVDRKDECLVPWDFDWTPESAITDDWFCDLYSQLPYGAHFLVMLDCCHSGGMARAGGGRPRGINPPDDIRHRALRWDAGRQMWADRHLASPNRALSREYLGRDRATRRLGRATELLPLSNRRYDSVRRRYQHRGPYLPVILQACQEQELAYEYRHGVTSYGAFSYAAALELRRSATGARGQSFATLVRRVTRTIQALGYEQTPRLLGPSRVLRRAIPWR